MDFYDAFLLIYKSRVGGIILVINKEGYVRVIRCVVSSVFLVCSLVLLPLQADQSVASLDDIREAARQFAEANENLGLVRKKDKNFAAKYNGYRDARDSFKRAWYGVPRSMKEDYIDLATQISQQVEGVKEGKSAREILVWGAKWKTRKPQKPVLLETTFIDLVDVASDFVSRYTVVLREKPYADFKTAKGNFKVLVDRYIKEGGSVTSLLEALQFMHGQKAIKKVQAWIAKGIIMISND